MQENILDYARIALYTVLLILGFFLFQAWNHEHPPVAHHEASIPTAPAMQTTQAATTAPIAATSVTGTPNAITPTENTQLIHVTTDVLDVTIDPQGGDITQVKLLAYPESLGSKQPYLLLNDNPATRYLAESGLLSNSGPDTAEAQARYTSPQTKYQLAPNTQDVTVQLSWQKEGLTVTKTLTFTRGSYEIKVGYDIVNHTSAPWQGSLYTQLMRTNTPPTTQGGFLNMTTTTYFGAAVSSPAKPFTKVTFKEMQGNNFSATSQDGWAAMIQHYFISAWVPPANTTSNYYSRVNPNGLYTIGFITQPLSVAPNSAASTQAKLYIGPSIAAQLEKVAPNLKLTIDYGWFWFISGIIFWMMQKIYDVVGNWGWSIVLVTVIIKLIFYHLSAKSYRSMSMLKKLQPKIESLKEHFGNDKQKLTQATLDLYRQEKVNPMSGCLPLLIQIPVFIALYWVLVESVQLRQAPFILWIHDLSLHDPYYILPLLMGISMFIQQRLNPPPADPMQAKIMMFLPVIFTVCFANFPAGLMLYWFVNNTLSFLQQWMIMRSVNKATS